MGNQKTIGGEVSFSGRGFMLNTLTEVTLAPAAVNAGIYFIRTDLPNAPKVQATPPNLRLSPNCTTLQREDAKVIVVEHLMSACWSLGITNLEVRINGAEVPTFDGSAMPFAEFLQEAEIVEQDIEVKCVEVLNPIVVREDEEKFIIVTPSEEFRVGYVLRYPENPELGTDYLILNHEKLKEPSEILPARTFIPESEAKRLLTEGLITSTDESMGVVVRKGDNPKLRLPSEFARHKILDMVGDLSVLGRQIKGQFLGVMSGHKLNAKMVWALYARYPG